MKMLKEARELQEKAVNRLISLIAIKDKKEFTFKAPTGSGKTYMMAMLCDEILSKNKNVIFLISSLSKGGLASQNYNKFKEYTDKGLFHSITPYLINTDVSSEEKIKIDRYHNVYFLSRDLYKEKSKLKENGNPLESFLREITGINNYESMLQNFTLRSDFKDVYLIKDECHIATNNLDELKNYFVKVINFSATPKIRKGQNPDVEITEQEAENASLIKAVNWNTEYNVSFDEVIKKFEQLKNDYISKIGTVNPCLIVQISNKNKADEEVKQIKEVINKHKELKWMLLVDKEKDCDTNDIVKAKKRPVSTWKNLVKENTSSIDIIIFKMVITEGYDIPRACMLYQVRDTESKILDEQVVGRVRRNPILVNYENYSKDVQDLVKKAYVYGVKNNDDHTTRVINLQDKTIQKTLTFKTTELKSLDKNKEFNIETFLNSKPKEKAVKKSIFDLYKAFKSADAEIQNLIYDYASSSSKKWQHATEYIKEIEEKNINYITDYSKSLAVKKDENGKDYVHELPFNIYIDEGNDNRRSIKHSIWIQTNANSPYDFAFDSQTESEWAGILEELEEKAEYISSQDATLFDEEKKVYFWGKNYPGTDSVSFPYYNDGVRKSYPDFIFKDKNGNVHLFEVKSLNKSSNSSIDTEEYENKVNALKIAYKATSAILPSYNFYIPIKNEKNWQIYRYKEGQESILSLEEFKNTIKKL